MSIITTQSAHVVVVGGGYAGMLAALRLAGKGGPAAQVTLINGSAEFVERIRLHQQATGHRPRRRDLARWLPSAGVAFRQGWVTEIRPGDNALVVATGDGHERIAYDYLIYAVGSTIDRSSVPGVAAHTQTLANVERAQAAHERLAAAAAKRGRLLVIGGGLTGIEMATEAAERYPQLQVTLATRGEVGPGLSTRGRAYLRRTFAKLGIELLEGTEVVEVQARYAQTPEGTALPFDVCLWAGAFQVPSLAQRSGVPVNGAGRVRVDEYLRSTAYPNIYAVGDAAATPLRMACATAMPMGAYAADHLAAQLTGQTQPRAFSFGYFLQCISLGRRRGLVQFVHPYDRPRPHILTGAAAALVKELICRYTVWSLHVEQRWPGSYRWPQAPLQAPTAHQHALPDALFRA